MYGVKGQYVMGLYINNEEIPNKVRRASTDLARHFI